MARSTSLLWATHHLLQPFRPVAKSRSMGPVMDSLAAAHDAAVQMIARRINKQNSCCGGHERAACPSGTYSGRSSFVLGAGGALAAMNKACKTGQASLVRTEPNSHQGRGATVSAIISDVFMAKLVCCSPPEAAISPELIGA